MPEPDKTHDQSLVVVDTAKLKMDHADYSSMTEQETRRAIKKLLDKYNFGINPELVSFKRLMADIADPLLPPGAPPVPMPDYVHGQATMEGVVWVRCYYDGTSKTGIIKNGHPVCFCMVTGDTVTGVHASWGPDEYKIVGVALDDYSVVDSVFALRKGGRIPVRLSPPAAASAEDVRIAATTSHPPDSPGGEPQPYPQFDQQRKVFPIIFYANPSYNKDQPYATIISGGGGSYDYVYNNEHPSWIPQGTTLIVWKVGSQWYTKYTEQPFFIFTLYEDLLPNGEAEYITSLGGTPDGRKVKTFFAKPGYKYASGMTGIACRMALTPGTVSGVVVKMFACPVPQ